MKIRIAILLEVLGLAIGEDIVLSESAMKEIETAVLATLTGPAAEQHDRRVFALRAEQVPE